MVVVNRIFILTFCSFQDKSSKYNRVNTLFVAWPIKMIDKKIRKHPITEKLLFSVLLEVMFCDIKSLMILRALIFVA